MKLKAIITLSNFFFKNGLIKVLFVLISKSALVIVEKGFNIFSIKPEKGSYARESQSYPETIIHIREIVVMVVTYTIIFGDFV